MSNLLGVIRKSIIFFPDLDLIFLNTRFIPKQS